MTAPKNPLPVKNKQPSFIGRALRLIAIPLGALWAIDRYFQVGGCVGEGGACESLYSPTSLILAGLIVFLSLIGLGLFAGLCLAWLKRRRSKNKGFSVRLED